MSTDLHDRTRQPSPEEGPDKQGPKSSLSIAQVVGGALAAMTAAALGSRLSVAGTVVGAAFASVIAAVAGALYTASLRRTSRHMSTVLSRVRPVTPGTAPDRAETSPSPATSADTAVDGAWLRPAEPARRPEGTTPEVRRPPTAWKRVVVGSLLMFVVAAVALTGIELVTGHALSGGTGTTVGQVADPATRPSSTPTERTTPTRSASPSATASARPATSAEPSATASSAPSSEPTVAPTANPSEASTPTVTATAEPSSAPSAAGGSAGPTPAP